MSVRAGSIQPYQLTIEEADGTAVIGAVIGDLVINASNEAGAFVLSATLTEVGSGNYRLLVTMPSTAGGITWSITHTTTDYIVQPGYFSETIELYDNDRLAALLTTTGEAVGTALLLEDVSLGDVIIGDAWTSFDLTVADAILEQWGYTDCTGFTAAMLQAAIRLETDGTEYPITTAWVDQANNQYSLSWDTFPAQLLTDLANAQDTTLYIDVQIIDTAQTPDRIVTVGRYTLQARWQRDTRTTTS